MELCAQALLLYGLEFDQAPLKIPGSIRPPEAARIIADYQPLFKLLPPTASWVYDAYTVIINDQYICDAAYANVFKSPLGFVVPIGWGVGSNSTGLQPPGVLQKISVRQRYDWDIKVSVMFPGSDVLAPVNYSVRCVSSSTPLPASVRPCHFFTQNCDDRTVRPNPCLCTSWSRSPGTSLPLLLAPYHVAQLPRNQPWDTTQIDVFNLELRHGCAVLLITGSIR